MWARAETAKISPRLTSLIYKLAGLLLFLLFSCLSAAIYGAVHNQISYTVAPSYFHEFKFFQFRIDEPLQNRVGAALVGARASWFMGLIIGLPIYIAAALFIKRERFLRSLLKATALVIGITLLFGLCALAYAAVTLSADNLPTWTEGRSLTQPLQFARAGSMHNASYLGGMVGIIAGLIYVSWTAIKNKQYRA